MIKKETDRWNGDYLEITEFGSTIKIYSKGYIEVELWKNLDNPYYSAEHMDGSFSVDLAELKKQLEDL